MTVLNWWKRHPRWRMMFWGFCNPTVPAPPWNKSEWAELERDKIFRDLSEQFRRDAEQAWRNR